MSVTRNMFAPNLDIEVLVQALIAWYSVQNLDVERLPGDTVLLQCREHQAWRKFVGMAMGLHIELNYSDPGLVVTISAGKWVDKAIVGGLAVVTMSTGIGLPLAIPAAFGYWQQQKLPARTFSFIEEVLASQEKRAPPDLPSRRLDPLPKAASPSNTLKPEDLVGSKFSTKSAADGHSPGVRNGANRPPLVEDDPVSDIVLTKRTSSTTTQMLTCSQCGNQVKLGKPYCGECGLQFNKSDANGTDNAILVSSQISQVKDIKVGEKITSRTTFNGVICVIDDGGQRINLPTRNEVIVGRRNIAKKYFPQLDLGPYKGEACGVSFEHARLSLQNGQIMLEDLDAPGGTWLGNERLPSRAPYPLRNGNKMSFAKLVVTILIP